MNRKRSRTSAAGALVGAAIAGGVAYATIPWDPTGRSTASTGSARTTRRGTCAWSTIRPPAGRTRRRSRGTSRAFKGPRGRRVTRVIRGIQGPAGLSKGREASRASRDLRAEGRHGLHRRQRPARHCRDLRISDHRQGEGHPRLTTQTVEIDCPAGKVGIDGGEMAGFAVNATPYNALVYPSKPVGSGLPAYCEQWRSHHRDHVPLGGVCERGVTLDVVEVLARR